MSSRKVFFALLIIPLLLFIFLFSNKDNIEESLSPKNATYLIDDQEVTLTDGYAEEVIAEDSATKVITRIFSSSTVGDFDGDGVEDTALLLTQDTGGSGIFYYVAVFDGKKGSNAILIGDRIAPQNIVFSDGQIIVNYATRLPEESFSDPASIGVSDYFYFKDGVLYVAGLS